MIKRLRQQIRGYTMPEYLIDILTHQYSECFLPMNIIRQNDSYQFTYDTGHFERAEVRRMDLNEKARLILVLIQLNDIGEDHLIGAERYLVEPELIYRRGKILSVNSVRLLYYPDLKSQSFTVKLIQFLEKIRSGITGEEELFERIRKALEEGDLSRAERTLEKFLQKTADSES